MTPEQEQFKKAIIAKIEAGSKLSTEEEYFYLTQVLQKSPEEADTIISIAENTDQNVLID